MKIVPKTSLKKTSGPCIERYNSYTLNNSHSYITRLQDHHVEIVDVMGQKLPSWITLQWHSMHAELKSVSEGL
jgi:hypothetical protein